MDWHDYCLQLLQYMQSDEKFDVSFDTKLIGFVKSEDGKVKQIKTIDKSGKEQLLMCDRVILCEGN